MRYAEVPLAVQTRRVVSIDALRGFNIFWIIGGDGAIWALAEMCKGKGSVVSSLGSFLGTQFSRGVGRLSLLRFHLPLFIFVTVSIVLSLTRMVEREAGPRRIFKSCAGRISTAWG
jgi:hypothetical protein